MMDERWYHKIHFHNRKPWKLVLGFFLSSAVLFACEQAFVPPLNQPTHILLKCAVYGWRIPDGSPCSTYEYSFAENIKLHLEDHGTLPALYHSIVFHFTYSYDGEHRMAEYYMIHRGER